MLMVIVMPRFRTLVMVGFPSACIAVAVAVTVGGCINDPVGSDAGVDAPPQDSPSTADNFTTDAGGDAGSGRCDPTKPFAAPTAVTELNSTHDDSAPHLSWDELTVYFGRRPASDTDPFKVYYARRASTSDPFGAPV